MYPNIEWITNNKGDIKKENYDACDSLVCSLAFININRNGVCSAKITGSIIEQNEKTTNITYTMEMWGENYEKEIILNN
jgi:hypothetical protein